MPVQVQQRGREEQMFQFDEGESWEVTEHGVLEVRNEAGDVIGSYHRDVWACAIRPETS